MEPFVIYILKSAGLLSIFYLSYLLLLKNDTSFVTNRRFLLGGILAAIILPAVNFTKTVVIEAPLAGIEYAPVTPGLTPLPIEQPTDWWFVAGVIYLLILGSLLVRFCLQLFRIIHLINTHPQYVSGKFKFIETSRVAGPFSFFNYIVFNPQSHSEKELELILLHEKIHAGQYHSLDILLSNLASCFLWFNPLSWFYKKSIVQNLEYIADRETVVASASKKEYLQTLVKVSIGDLQPALTNSFYQSFIKKRIVMLNKKSTTKNLWKTSLVIPLVLVFILVFNVKTEAKILPPNPSVESEEEVNLSELQQELLEANFTETTSRAQLREYKDVFAERNIDLETDQVEYSADRLKGIRVQYTLPEGSSREHISRTSNDGKLIPFKLVATFNEEGEVRTIFFVEEDRESRVTSEEEKTPSQINRKVGNGISIKPRKPQSKNDSINPVYVIDGERIENASIANALDPEQIEKIEVLKGASAVSLYGQAAKEGAVIITTKKAKDSSNTGSFNFNTGTLILKDSAKGNGRTYQASKIRFLEKDSVRENRRSLSISGEKSKYHDKPLVIVDGEEKPADFEINDIDEENIKSINIIKGDGAVEKHGEKASGGVIEITTKTSKDAKDNP